MQIPSYLNQRDPNTHKGHYGHALLIAGSYGKMGAAVLAARACLRSGVGLLTVHVPKRGVEILQTAVPEAMVSIDESEFISSSLLQDLDRYDAFAIGPGIGLSPETESVVQHLIDYTRTCSKPLIIDADGLTLLGNLIQKHTSSILHSSMILTPHAKEFQRLYPNQVFSSSDEAIQAMTRLAQTYGLQIVYKGHQSKVAVAQAPLYTNTTGNPGMATAGSGDVLTGITLAFAAQQWAYKQRNIEIRNNQPVLSLAVYIHGKSGDIAAQKRGFASLIATDIVENISNAILS